MNDIIEFHAAPIPGRAIRPSSIPQQSFPCERGFPADFTTEAPQGDNFVRFPIDNVIDRTRFTTANLTTIINSCEIYE